MLQNLLREYQDIHRDSDGSIDLLAFLSSRPHCSSAARLKIILYDIQERWKSSQPWKVEDYLERFPEFANDSDAIFALVQAERKAQFGIESTPERPEIVQRFPQLARHLPELLQSSDSKNLEFDSLFSTMSRNLDSTKDEILASRYRILRLLGQGAFGRVFLALDVELERQVAIKVPLPDRFQGPDDADTYLAEARTVASLNHPHIVPVYDMGRTPDGAVFVVSRYIEGTTLEELLNSKRLPVNELIGLLKTVAEALHYAHGQRLIHRDVKPANILIEECSKTPFVADFGLAIREEEFAKYGGLAGTPTYMSPEQARGEGHRLDGRSDIFSLGVILYQGLTGQRPFRGGTLNELLHQIVSEEPRTPRCLREDISAELERICLKSLNKRVSDRYSNAAAMADDLAAWLQSKTSQTIPLHRNEPIVPKGLRSFDASDADFFLDLLPGLRNRDGLPESVAFWKQRIEQTDSEQTFSVGLIYGPSGCGKSSLVKAGLIPHLDKDVLAVYIEATAEDTESRILRGLRKRLPELSNDLGLADMFAAIRRAQGRKVVVIIDQFEQWLHAHRAETEAELVKALRQCDGGRLQAIVMIRDDFAMAAARFMNALDIPIVQGKNFATVDLFEVDHAEKVMIRFGQAFGKLPEKSGNLSAKEQQFVKDVTQGLTHEGKVISVRLSLFAEMVKSKPWTPATLQQIGGTEGIGVNFLEETFSSPQANPRHRLHSVAARSILNALLPELGTDIKGQMRSEAELLEVSGYQERPSDFNDLLRILDGELRLITPTDPEGHDSKSKDDFARQYFQLTHDYLIPSLREWLTRKQSETKRGRAELKLAERASIWNSKREDRQLPTAMEWLSIRRLTEWRRWTAPQREMMKRATRVYSLRAGIALVLLMACSLSGIAIRWQVLQRQEFTRVEGLVQQLVSADPNQIRSIIKQLDANYKVATGFLSPLLSADENSLDGQRALLHARIATASHDQSLVDPLLQELFTNKVTYIAPIREALRPYLLELTENLRTILRDEKADVNHRFRAAMMLADYIPVSDLASWTEMDLHFVAEQLVIENSEFQPLLRENLRPISKLLLPEIEKIFGDSTSTSSQQLSAANAFADYAARDIPKLSQLISIATSEQFAVLYPLVSASRMSSTVEDLSKITATLPTAELGSVERIAYGQRRANAAVTLLRLGERKKVLPVFDMTDDPESLTQFVFRCRDRGVRIEELLDLMSISNAGLGEGSSRSARERYALLLALGEYPSEDIPASHREPLLKQLAETYRNDPSSGVHSVSGWLLRRWGQADVVREVDETAVPYSSDREWFTLAIPVTVSPTSSPQKEPTDDQPASDVEGVKLAPVQKKTFYYTFVVFREGEFNIGSMNDEPDRNRQENNEVRHSVTLTRPFALLDREITFEELVAFNPEFFSGAMQEFAAKPSDSGFGLDWYWSVSFCRWLGHQLGIPEKDQSYEAIESLGKEDYLREPSALANWAPRNWPLNLAHAGFRLPTEAEWEVASRSECRTAYGYGSEVSLLNRFGWFIENSEAKVHPPRELRPNIRGLFDIHGNLYEWTHDWNFAFEVGNVVDPIISDEGTARVTRGGCWRNNARYCRSANRGATEPTARTNTIGLRIALSLSYE